MNEKALQILEQYDLEVLRSYGGRGGIMLETKDGLKMIKEFAEKEPETVRQMFKNLFDENKDLYDRIVSFKVQSKQLVNKYWDPGKSDFQTENTITTYLWLRYPDKYYIYKFEEAKSLSKELKMSNVFKAGDYQNNVENFIRLYD